jgi:hypothetical protein
MNMTYLTLIPNIGYYRIPLLNTPSCVVDFNLAVESISDIGGGDLPHIFCDQAASTIEGIRN